MFSLLQNKRNKKEGYRILKTTTLVPPVGIQETFISVTKIGNLNLLYDLNKSNDYSLFLSGAGTGSNKKKSTRLSEYEALERVANSINCRKVVIESGKNQESLIADMDHFPKLSNSEKSPNINYSKDETSCWVECIELPSKKTKLIPAGFIYLFNDDQFYGDMMVTPISTGASLHDNYIDAIINGIYEVIERDGIALTWLLNNVNGDVSHLFSEDEKRVFSNKFLGEVKFYDVSTVEGVITICAHARANYSKNCKNVLMFCSSINFEDIKQKLKKELISVMFSFYTNETSYDSKTDFTQFVSVNQSGTFMARDFNDQYFDFFKDVPKIDPEYHSYNRSSSKNELNHLLALLDDENFTIYATDISCREVLDKKCCAVKVVIPEAQPISFVYNSRYLSSNRLVKKAKEKYGNNYEEKINRMPLAFS